ncbi:hypothetical protein [Paenibacillus agricola]|nr:hypothetical protein [Paenibacillus agricola]
MSKEDAIKKLFELSVTFKGLRVRSYFGKNKEEKLEEIPPSPPEDQDPES